MSRAPRVIETVARVEGFEWVSRAGVADALADTGEMRGDQFPVLRDGACSVEVTCSYKEILDALRLGKDLSSLRAQQARIVLKPTGPAAIQVWQLTPL
jgi:hypothetical protein